MHPETQEKLIVFVFGVSLSFFGKLFCKLRHQWADNVVYEFIFEVIFTLFLQQIHSLLSHRDFHRTWFGLHCSNVALYFMKVFIFLIYIQANNLLHTLSHFGLTNDNQSVVILPHLFLNCWGFLVLFLDHDIGQCPDQLLFICPDIHEIILVYVFLSEDCNLLNDTENFSWNLFDIFWFEGF